jgi:hypothetical protein
MARILHTRPARPIHAPAIRRIRVVPLRPKVVQNTGGGARASPGIAPGLRHNLDARIILAILFNVIRLEPLVSFLGHKPLSRLFDDSLESPGPRPRGGNTAFWPPPLAGSREDLNRLGLNASLDVSTTGHRAEGARRPCTEGSRCRQGSRCPARINQCLAVGSQRNGARSNTHRVGVARRGWRRRAVRRRRCVPPLSVGDRHLL